MSHFFAPTLHPKIAETKADYKATKKQLDHLKDSISYQSAIAADIKLLENRYRQQKLLNSQAKEEHNIFGYNGLQGFLWSLGLGLILTVSGLYIMNKAIAEEEKSNRISESVFGVIVGSIGFYFFVWIFYPQKDLEPIVYIGTLILLAVLSSLTAYFITQRRIYTKKGLIVTIRHFLRWHYETAEEKQLIAKDKHDEFVKDRIELTERVAENG